MALICLFFADTAVFAATDTLAPSVGKPEVYQAMHIEMEERLYAHQDPIDEVIKQNSNKSKSLSSVPALEKEFKDCVNNCGAGNALTRLQTTLSASGGRIQIIFVKGEDELPVFYGKRVWGHAGTYVTVFALESEAKSNLGRKKIIARLFHEIRARSGRAKELFDEEIAIQNPVTPEEIGIIIKSARERFEETNLQMQNEIEDSGRITTPELAKEFAGLTFAAHPDSINRDYAMARKSGNSKKPAVLPNAQSADEAAIDSVIRDIRTELAKVDGVKVARKHVDESVRKILSGLRRGNGPYFNSIQLDNISKLKKLSQRLETLRFLFLHQNDGAFVFKGPHTTLALFSARTPEDIETLVGILEKLGIEGGYNIALILSTSRETSEEVPLLIGLLKELGVIESANIARSLACSRKQDEIEPIVGILGRLNITDGYSVSNILLSKRSETEIEPLIGLLRESGIVKNQDLSRVLRGSKGQEEIGPILSELKELRVVGGTNIALVLSSARKENEIEPIVRNLRKYGITKSLHIAMILSSSKKEKEMMDIIETLKKHGIENGDSIARIITSSRRGEEIDPLVAMLKSEGIEGISHLTHILTSIRKKDEIERLIGMLKKAGITEGGNLANVLCSSWREDDIKPRIDMAKGLGIEGEHSLALFMRSYWGKKKEIEIKSLIRKLNSRGIKKSVYIVTILASSDKEKEIIAFIDMLKRLGINKSHHIIRVMKTSRKMKEIEAIIKALKDLGIEDDGLIVRILLSARGRGDVLLCVRKLKALKNSIPDFAIPASLMTRIILSPEFMTGGFSNMLEGKAYLPPLDRLLSETEKEHVRFRLLLRKFSLDTIYGLIDIFINGREQAKELKLCINRRIAEERERSLRISNAEELSDSDYDEAGLLLFSCDENIRSKIRDKLINRNIGMINKFRDSDKRSLAGELITDASTRYNIYNHLLKDEPRRATYIGYLESCIKFTHILAYNRNLPQSLLEIKNEFKKFKSRFEKENSGELSEEDLIAAFDEETAYGFDVILMALGKVKVRSLNEKMGKDRHAERIDFVPAAAISGGFINKEFFGEGDGEDDYSFDGEDGDPFDDEDGDPFGSGWSPEKDKATGKGRRVAVGSIPNVFKYLCDNDITAASKSLSGQEISDGLGRSYLTINYDIRALLYHLKLIERSKNGPNAGNYARYYVPEAAKNKAAEILPILEQFTNDGLKRSSEKRLRPKQAILKQVYENEIRPIIESKEANVARNAEEAAIDDVIRDIRAELAKVDGIKVRREHINENIKRILLGLRRSNIPYFSPRHADEIVSLRKLDERLEILKLLFLYQDDGNFVFKGSDIPLVLISSRKEEEITPLLGLLKRRGFTKGAHIVQILASSRKGSEIKSRDDMLKTLGITEPTHRSAILFSSREDDEIRRLVITLKKKKFGITNPAHLALILCGSREEGEIYRLIPALKRLGFTKPAHLARILASSRGEREIKPLDRMLIKLGITEIANRARVLSSAKKDGKIMAIVGLLNEFGMTEGAHVEPVLAGSKKEDEIRSLLIALKELGMTKSLYLCKTLSCSRKSGEMLSGIKKLIALKKSIPDLAIPDSVMVRMIKSPGFFAHSLSYMLREKAGLPALDRPLTDAGKEYVRFRMLLRQFDLAAIYGLIDIFMDRRARAKALKLCISRRIAEDIEHSRRILEAKELSNGDYDEAGVLLFSCDENIRSKIMDKLIEVNDHRVREYGSGEKRSLADKIVVTVTRRHNIYNNLLKGKSGSASYVSYLISYLKYVHSVFYYENQPGSQQETRREFLAYKRRAKRAGSILSDNALINAFAKENGYNIDGVLQAVGKISLEELHRRISRYSDDDLIGLVPTSAVSDGFKDKEFFGIGEDGDPFNDEDGDPFGSGWSPEKGKAAGKGRRVAVGSIPSVFKYLCDNDITEASESLTIQDIAGDLGRAYNTISYDVKALLRLNLIIKSEDSAETGRGGRYYVPEAVKNAAAEILPILEQFEGKKLRPEPEVLDHVYNENIKVILIECYGEDLPDTIEQDKVSRALPEIPVWSENYVSPEEAQAVMDNSETVLTYEEEQALFKALYSSWPGSSRITKKMIFDYIIMKNQGLIKNTVKRLGMADLWEDAVQDGNIGLINAVERFDYRRGLKLSMFCGWYIRSAIQRGAMAFRRQIGVPANKTNELRLLNRAIATISNELGREPTIEEISDDLGMSEKRVKDVLGIEDLTPASLDKEMWSDGERLYDVIPDTVGITVKEDLEKLYPCLTFQERVVIKMANGVGTKNGAYSRAEIARILNLTREWTRQIEIKARKKLRSAAEKSRKIAQVTPAGSGNLDVYLTETLKVDPTSRLFEKLYSECSKSLNGWSEKAREIMAGSDLDKEALGKRRFEYRYSWDGGVDQGISNVRNGISKYKSDIIERYDNLDNLTDAEIGNLKRDICSMNANLFRRIGLGGAYSLTGAPYFEGGYIKSLQMTFPKLGLKREDFSRKKSPESSDEDLKPDEFKKELAGILGMDDIIELGKTTFIFSEKVTFEKGLERILPRLAKSGIKIAVIATNDKNKALIDELNHGKPENERIVCEDSVIAVRARVHTARCYYFKIAGEADALLASVTTFDITESVDRIIKALGRIRVIVEPAKLELHHETGVTLESSA